MYRDVKIANAKTDQVRLLIEIAAKVRSGVLGLAAVLTSGHPGRDEPSRDRRLRAAQPRCYSDQCEPLDNVQPRDLVEVIALPHARVYNVCSNADLTYTHAMRQVLR